MNTVGLNRRTMVSGLGVLGARAAMPMVATAGGILIPGTASASNISITVPAPMNVLSYIHDEGNKTFTFNRYEFGTKGRMVVINKVEYGNQVPVEILYHHNISGKLHISHYTNISFKFSTDRKNVTIALSNMTRRILKANYPHAKNHRNPPSIILPDGSIREKQFNTHQLWGVRNHYYTTYYIPASGSKPRVNWIDGWVQGEGISHPSNAHRWYRFTQSGTGRTETMQQLNNLLLAHKKLVSESTAATASTVLSAAAAGAAYYGLLGLAGPVGFAIATFAVLATVNSSSQWGQARNRINEWRTAHDNFLEYVKGRSNVQSWPN